MPSFLSNEIKEEVKNIIQKAALSMGIKNGIVKGDIVIHKSKPYIIEIAARLSGGYFCTHEIPMNTGVDFIGNAIKMAIGEKININDLNPKFNDNICQRYMFPKPGIVKEINGINELKKNPSVKYFNFHIGPGDKIEKPFAHPSRAGMIIVKGSSRVNAIKIAENAINSLEFNYQK